MNIANKFGFALAVTTALAGGARAQLTPGTNVVATNLDVSTPVVFSRDANSRVWATVAPVGTNEFGQITYRANTAYTELGAGLHYWSNGAWAESSSVIAITLEGAAATNAAQKAWFPANVNTAGGIRLHTPENLDLRSHVIGLSYATSTTNVLIGLLQDSTGTLVSTNQVLYTNAFAGAFTADVRYTFTGPGSVFEQDVLIQTQLPSPTNWGLAGRVTLQCWTEFVNPPQPAIAERSGSGGQRISFNGTRFGPGRAFIIGDEHNPTPVRTHWVVNPLDGRTCLLEEIDLASISSQLNSLPTWSGGGTNGSAGIGGQAGLYPGFPNQLPPAPKLAQRNGESIKIASASVSTAPAFALDYVTLSTAHTNYTFEGGSTYFISNGLALLGTTTIEPGAVLKYADSSLYWGLDLYGPLVCPTNIYRPAVFTSKDDNSVGATISGSTGSPATATNVFYLYLDEPGITGIANCRFSYAALGAMVLSSSELEVQNCQFVNCNWGLANRGTNNLSLRNVLFSGGNRAIHFWQNAITLNAEQVTSTSTNFWTYFDYHPVLHLTNSILYGFSAPSNYTAQPYAITNPVGTIFQTVVGGNYYLADNSPYRDSGTGGISGTAAALIAAGTTYPPVVLTNNFTANTTLSPQAARDTDTPDYGYHYSPLDYVLSNRTISGATLTLTNGVSVGVFGTNGLTFSTSSPGLVSAGSALNLNHLLPCAAVQEQPMTRLKTLVNLAGVANIDLSFTDLPMLGGEGCYALVTESDGNSHNYGTLKLRDCQLGGGVLYVLVGSASDGAGGFSSVTVSLTNNVFDRCATTLYRYYNYPPAFNLSSYNNLFHGGTLKLEHDAGYTGDTSPPTWTIRDNLFEGVAIIYAYSTSAYVANDHNAYFNSTPLSNSGGNDVSRTNADYQIGVLGSWYYPASGTNLAALINAGSRNADLAGLYHYTVTTNQVKETNSPADIGRHFISLNGGGNPVDTDTDGVPDYVENSHGGGTVVSGETDWQSATDHGFKVLITRPRNNSIVP